LRAASENLKRRCAEATAARFITQMIDRGRWEHEPKPLSFFSERCATERLAQAK